MLAAGDSYSEICERLGCTDRYISLWKEHFQQERLSGLDSRYPGAEHRRRTAETEARVLVRLSPEIQCHEHAAGHGGVQLCKFVF